MTSPLLLDDAISHAEAPGEETVLAVPVTKGNGNGGEIALADPGGADPDLAYLSSRGFEAKLGETAAVRVDGRTVLAVGVGPATKVTAEVLRTAAAAVARACQFDHSVATTLPAAASAGLDPVAAAQAVTEGLVLGSYAFTRHRKVVKPARLVAATVVGPTAGAGGVDRGRHVARGVCLARDLVNEPAGSLAPADLADAAIAMAAGTGLEVEVMDEVAMASAGLGGILGVGAGSARPPRLIRITHSPPGASHSLALVGKGITFDSGGLSIKPADGMETMKTDMSGAAAVIGAMSVIAALDLPVRVVAFVPTAENMPSGTAIRPGDVLRIRNGKTVEVLNTDAEGRLVLADALSLAVEEGVEAIVDAATLTGACVVALGKKVAGLMSNDEAWTAQVGRAAARAGERVWPLPLPPEYRRSLDSEVADLRNISTGRWGGALTAGIFLSEFVGSVPWAHLDIAGPARADEDDGFNPKGGTGFGVRTLVETVASFTPPRPAEELENN